MLYQVYNVQKQCAEAEFFEREDAIQFIEDNGSFDTHKIYKVIPCRGCETTNIDVIEERHDYYGISTGNWCDDCYENNYPYKKERYATEEYDGYGERLTNEY